jgi:hypothetical protein
MDASQEPKVRSSMFIAKEEHGNTIEEAIPIPR